MSFASVAKTHIVDDEACAVPMQAFLLLGKGAKYSQEFMQDLYMQQAQNSFSRKSQAAQRQRQLAEDRRAQIFYDTTKAQRVVPCPETGEFVLVNEADPEKAREALIQANQEAYALSQTAMAYEMQKTNFSQLKNQQELLKTLGDKKKKKEHDSTLQKMMMSSDPRTRQAALFVGSNKGKKRQETIKGLNTMLQMGMYQQGTEGGLGSSGFGQAFFAMNAFGGL